MKSAAIAIVRNAVDLAPLTALHHWLIGVDCVWVVDNGSTDGTYGALKWLAGRLPGFRVDSDPGPFDQARMTNDLANALLREGFRTIIPFDADECWNLSLGHLAQEFRKHHANALSYPVVNYIQSRAVLQAAPGAWRPAIRRVARTYNPPVPMMRVVGTQRISFVERAFGRKVLIQPPPGQEVALVKGNHSVTFEGQKCAELRSIACLHLPLRAASELEKRAMEKDRHAPFFLTPRHGWRLDYWQERIDSGNLMKEWAANSYDADGMLDVYGKQRPTIVDRRLVGHLSRAERFRKAMEMTGGRAWVLPLRFAFKARPGRFTVPKSIKDLDGLPPVAAQQG